MLAKQQTSSLHRQPFTIAGLSKAENALARLLKVSWCVVTIGVFRRNVSGKCLTVTWKRWLAMLGPMVLVRRELLSCVSAVYVVIPESYTERQPLWRPAIKELSWLWALLPTAIADVGRNWSTWHHDASLAG